VFIPFQLFSNDCPSSKYLFSSDDGKHEFRVNRVAYKHLLLCGKIKDETDPPIYMEINSPDINFSWYYDRMIFKDQEKGIEKPPMHCNSVRWITVAEGLYNDVLTYIVSTNTRGQSNCCTTKKYTKMEFLKGSFEDDLSLERIRWLSDNEASNLLFGYDPNEPDLPKIQFFDGIEFKGPVLKLSDCQDS